MSLGENFHPQLTDILIGTQSFLGRLDVLGNCGRRSRLTGCSGSCLQVHFQLVILLVRLTTQIEQETGRLACSLQLVGLHVNEDVPSLAFQLY